MTRTKMTNRTWYRGDSGGGYTTVATYTWYAADRAYAAFFGPVSEITESELGIARVLDLRGLGIGDVEEETYLRVERLADRLARRYDAVRVLQWHADYSGAPQDTLLVL